MEKIVLVALASGVVVDRSVLVTLTSDQLQEQLTSPVLRNTKVRVVNNFAGFFNSTNMLALMEVNNDDYKLIAEKAGISINPAEVAAMQRVMEFRKEITEKMTPPVPPYPFAKVTEGWSVANNLEICNQNKFVRRKGGGRHISLVQLRRVWDYYSMYWAGLGNHGPYTTVIAGGGGRTVERLEGDLIKIGCQSIQRFELEQFALHQNWEFPAPKDK